MVETTTIRNGSDDQIIDMLIGRMINGDFFQDEDVVDQVAYEERWRGMSDRSYFWWLLQEETYVRVTGSDGKLFWITEEAYDKRIEIQEAYDARIEEKARKDFLTHYNLENVYKYG